MPSSSAFVAATPSSWPLVRSARARGARRRGSRRGTRRPDRRAAAPSAARSPARVLRDELGAAPAARERERLVTVARRTSASSSAVSTLADARAPECSSSSGRCQHPSVRSDAARRRRRSSSTGAPHSAVASSAGLPIVALAKQNVGLRLVVLADASQPAEHVRDVAAEDAAQRVQLVDHDVAQPHEERRPPLMRREDAHVQHLGVGEHDVGVACAPTRGRRSAVSPS